MIPVNIAGSNSDKSNEIASILQQYGISSKLLEVRSMPPTASGTFRERAVAKTLAYTSESAGWTISEQSELIVEAIGGLPGDWSAEFSDCRLARRSYQVIGYHASNQPRELIDQRNNQRVLDLMRGIESPRDRQARFVVSLVVAVQHGIIWQDTGEARGWISHTLRGTGGFGYDPIFIGEHSLGKTFAELDPQDKNSQSHRWQVLEKFQSWLQEFLSL